MKAFRFRFDALLRKAEIVERECQRALAERLRLRMIIENQLGMMRDRLRAAKHDLGDRLVGRVDLVAVSQVAAHAVDTDLRGRLLGQKLEQAEQQVRVARAQLAEAMRQRKLYETIRQRDLDRWRAERRRAEDRANDDYNQQAFARALMTAAV